MNLKNLISASLFAGSTLIATSAMAVPFSTVGSVDNFLSSADLGNSGDEAEESWVESILGFDVTLDAKDETGGTNWELVDGETDVYATSLDTDPSYFLIKLGTGGTDLDHSHYLFENIGEMSWAVVDFSEAGVDFEVTNINIGRLSHTSEFDGTEVPEPASIALLGLGLVGLGVARKRKA